MGVGRKTADRELDGKREKCSKAEKNRRGDNGNMKSLYSLFLSQAYQDCWDDYNRSVKLKNFPRWDYVILTASNDQQAEGFRRQIAERKEYLPAGTRFVAIPDRDGKRVGSGGATLEVLKYLHEQEGDFQKLLW